MGNKETLEEAGEKWFKEIGGEASFMKAMEFGAKWQADHIENLLEKVRRFEVIDHTKKNRGRIVVEYGVVVDVSIQDDGRTMKVFLTDAKQKENGK